MFKTIHAFEVKPARQKLYAKEDEIRRTMERFDDNYPLGHYFLWAIVNVGGKRNYKVCVGSGVSSQIDQVIDSVKKIPGVVRAWYNLD